ncbi:MAG: MerR family transcriptional regulator [Sulfurovaceae bacterium]|nr:MerR family transcriptional regulator [Sulfurovaceae bacterium]MDD5548454.1 MerR family transcriptional regulator [Sulfurovaceae bacterium]
MALLDNAKDILPLSSIAELLNAKVRTLKIYEEKDLLPKKQKGSSKKLYSIDDIQHITFVHYLVSIKKINANGIRYILDILKDNMDENSRKEFFDIINKKMSGLSSKDVQEVTSLE